MCSFSIIIPAYNVEKFFTDCLSSVHAQSFFDWEAIIIDDGSTDQTANIADEWTEKDARFQVIHQSNQGPSSARNIALRHAQGNYVLFLDGDDTLKPYALEYLYEIISKHTPDIVAFSSELWWWEESRTSANEAFNPVSEWVFPNGQAYLDDFVKRRKWGPSAVCFYAWRRQLIKESGVVFPQGIFHEDDYFVPVMLLNALNKVVTTLSVLYSYRMRSGSIVHAETPKHGYDLLTVASMLENYFKTMNYKNNYANRLIFNLALKGIGKLKQNKMSIGVKQQMVLWHHVSTLKDIVKGILLMLE